MEVHLKKLALTLVSMTLLVHSCANGPLATGASSPQDAEFSFQILDYQVASSDEVTSITSNGQVQQVRRGQLVLFWDEDTPVSQFLENSGLSLIRRAQIPSEPLAISVKDGSVVSGQNPDYVDSPLYLVAAEGLDTEDLSDMSELASKAGLKGEHVFSSREAAALVHRMLRIRSKGLTARSSISLNTELKPTGLTYEGAESINTYATASPSNTFWFTNPAWLSSSNGYGANYNEPSGNEYWNYTTGLGTDIAVIDQGFYSSSSDLSSYWVGNSQTVYTYDFENDQPNIAGLGGHTGWHGRKVASLIFAPPDDNANTVGTAPDAVPYLMHAHTQYGVAYAVQTAISWGCDVINISQGASNPYIGWYGQYDAMHTILQTANDNDVVTVCSAGNDGDDPYFFPAAYNRSNRAVNVGAHNRNGKVSYWPGSGQSNTYGVDIYAPGGGGDIGGPLRAGTGWDVPVADIPGQYSFLFTTSFGTSMSAPIVSGVVAGLYSRGRVSDVPTTRNYFNARHTSFTGGVSRALDALWAMQ